ncbi:MAG TPA: peroxiredoxin [Acidobacteria bacterium]|nr:peroxiredoxin [Acidobacteriota bacterium]
MATSKIEVGRRAPQFTLPAASGARVALRDLAGSWVVLYFYPKDDTPGCTKEACEFSSALKAFETLDAVVYGCSPDSVERHRRFIEKYDLKIDLLSDEKKTVMEKYGAWGEKVLYGRKSIGVIRSTLIIDPQGKVAHHWKKVRVAGHAEKVRERLAALQSGERGASGA